MFIYIYIYICMSAYNSSSLTSSRPWTIFVTSFFHVKLNCYLKICTCPLTAHICIVFMYNYDKCYCCQLCCLKLLISVRNPSSTLLLLQYTFHLLSFPHNLISETSGIMVTFNRLHGLTSSYFSTGVVQCIFLSSYLN